jgi:hypothetical protein
LGLTYVLKKDDGVSRIGHKNSKKDSRRAYRVYGIISKPVTKGDSTQILKTVSSYFLTFALVKFENDASIFTCEMFVAKILGKKV